VAMKRVHFTQDIGLIGVEDVMSRIRDSDHKYLYGTTGDFAQNKVLRGVVGCFGKQTVLVVVVFAVPQSNTLRSTAGW
jgi:hypothetical protein